MNELPTKSKERVYDVCRGYFDDLYTSVHSLQEQLNAANEEKKFWRSMVGTIIIVALIVNGWAIASTSGVMLLIYILSIIV